MSLPHTETEAQIERQLRNRVKAIGGVAIKLLPSIAGIPDRMVMLPGGMIRFVELKTKRGRVRPVQKVWFDKFAELGHPVTVLRSIAEVDAWIDEALEKGEADE